MPLIFFFFFFFFIFSPQKRAGDLGYATKHLRGLHGWFRAATATLLAVIALLRKRVGAVGCLDLQQRTKRVCR